MQNMTIKLYTLSYTDVRTYVMSTLFVLGNIVLRNYSILCRKAE